MKTKKGSPSGVGCRIHAATKSKPIFLTGIGFSQSVLRLLLVLLVLPMAWMNAWAGGILYNGGTWAEATSKNTAQGLVYASTNKNANPAITQYTSPSSTEELKGGGENVQKDFYIWAKPARGFYFSGWSDKGGQAYAVPATNTGNGDTFQGTTPRKQDLASTINANFQPLTPYDVVYEQPNGGSYTVRYLYLSVDESTVRFNTNDGETLQLTPTSGDLRPTDSKDATNHKTYATDSIILSTENTNFIGWYKNGVFMSSANPYTKYKASEGATISAMFKEIGWGDVKGDLAVNVTATGTYGEKKIAIGCPTLIGTWVDADFTVSPMNSSNEYGSIVVNNIHLDDDSLRITYTYTATGYGGISVDVTVTPAYGVTKTFTIAANAEEVVTYEACIEESGVRTYTGTLAEMMTQANSMTNKPTLKLMQDKTITTPLSFTQSFTFDVNGRVLTANCASAFSINAAGVDVKIIDGSFTQTGEIHTSYASTGNVNVVTFTQAAKLTMQGGTLSADNTGSGSAYGLDVQQGSIFYMTNGQLTVSAATGDAQGVHVATASDYATFNGGSLTVSAPTNAYGLWSAGQSNITNATISVATTTGANAYGAYVNGGVSTLTGNTITADAKTTNAYGAYVKAGRMNGNGGSFAASAVTDKVYGVYVAADATAMLQQKATVIAEITTGNGSSNVEVCGVNNLGTVNLYNISVTATSATNNAAAVNAVTSAVSTTIEMGSYFAQTTTGYAYGLHHQHGELSVDEGTFRATGGGNEIYGVLASEDATIANATLYGETQGSGNTVYGFKGDGSGKNISLSGCAIEAVSNTNKAYAVYSNANVTVNGCTLTATTLGTSEAYGFYAKSGTNNLTNCNATVISKTVQAYGVNHVAGSLTIEGGQYDVDAKQASATAAQSSQAYGLYNAASQTTTVNGTTFNVVASNNTWSQYPFAAYINGTLNSTNATYSATGRTYVYCVYGLGSSTLNLTGNTITSTTTNGQYSYGIYAKKNFTIDGDVVSAIGSTTDVYAMFFDANNSIGEVRDGKFTAQGNGTNGYGALNAAGSVGKVKLKGGVYKTTINLQKYAYTGYQLYHLDETHPDYAGGYRYTIAAENPSPYVCHIVNGAYYTTLEAAMQYALDNTGNYTIVMTQTYTLPAGDYTLPSNATLIVPCRSGQTSIVQDNPNNPAMPDRRTTVGLREDFICLTMAANAHINVNGKIGISGDMYCKESGYTGYNNTPFGRIHMEAGSLIQLNSGARLYAWGFITGAGNIKVKNNAEVHEMFQVGDMQTVGNLADGYYGNAHGHFLINQYSIPNIEVPTTYYYNSRLIGAMFSYYKGTNSYQGGNEIKLVGTSDALFEVTTDDESAWVRKSYDAAHDYQVWDVNSSAQLGSIELTVASQSINSLDYILPITSNMKIHILDGEFKITQSTEFLPGATLEIDKTASLTINETYKNSSNKTKNLNVYVFDKDQWTLTTSSCSPIYSPSWPNGSKPSRTVGDAAINIHGNIDVKGSLYTTRSISGGTNTTYGANIYSNNTDAGTIYLENTAPSSQTSINIITGVSNHSLVTKEVTMDPALLKNGTGASQAFTPTSGTAANHSFAYMDNEWTETYTEGCFEFKGDVAYAKPSDYVALKKQRDEVGDYDDLYITDKHTYLSTDESRIFIQVLDAEGNCQWWEVEETSDPTVFECKKTGYEGFYYYDESNELWTLKTVKVKFYAAEEGDAVLKEIITNFNGIPDHAVIESNPSKPTEIGYTYQFYGWKSSVSGTTYPWTNQLEVATADMSYRPVFTKTPRNYTITFINANNGADIPVETAYNTHPICTPAPTKAATAQYTYYFQNWEGYEPDAELPAVTGATSYTAVWAQTVNKYTITWKNGDEVLETDTKQPYGTATAFNGTLPTKETDNNYVYAFSGWLSSMTGQTYANESTPEVAGETTYEAQFSTTPRYDITFANYDGTQLQKEPVTAGEHPIYNGLTPGRVRDLDGYFKFIGWKNSDGTDFAPNATLPEVTGKETYTAQYDYVTELYWITLHNVTGKNDLTDEDDNWRGKFGVESTPYYDPDNDDVADMPTKADGMEDGLMYVYTFSGWNPELQPVSGEAEYTAQFEKEVKKYNITFANLDGNGAQQTIEVAYGTTPVSPVEPAKGDLYCTYEFLEWDNTIVAVTGDATYTAQFSEDCTPRTFPITFDPDNGVDAPYVLNVAYGQTPTPEDPATWQDAANIYTFSGWTPAIHAVDGPAEYTAQYTPTIRTYTIRFVNYDGTELQSTSMTYGATPSYSGTPEKPVDLVNLKKYTFTGWSPSISSATTDAVYTATYSEQSVVATVTTSSNETTYHSTWNEAKNKANQNSDCTLKLYANVTVDNNTGITKTMTIDLNGCTMSCETSTTSNQRMLDIETANVALTIIDSNPLGGGKISYTGTGNKDYRAIYAKYSSVSVTIESGIVECISTNTGNSAAAYAVYLSEKAKFYMNGGVLIATSATKAYAEGGNYNMQDGAKYATITGGKLRASVNGSYTNNNAYIFAYVNYVTASGGYYTKDPGSITCVSGYEKRSVGDSEPEKAEGYTHKVVRVYTVTFQNYDGSNLETPKTWEVGTTPSYTGATPTREPQSLYTFRAWKAEGDDSEYTTTFPAVTGNTTYVAQYDVVEEFDVTGNTPVENDAAVTTTTVHMNGTLDVENGVTLTTTNLILEASETGSGQIIKSGTIVADNVYYDLTLNTAARHWHAFGVPWAVDLNVNPLTEVETGRTLTLGSNYEIVYYDTHTRATAGPGANCWKYLKHYDETGQPIEVLNPGQGYMIAFTTPVQTVRFVKKSDAPIIFNGSVTVTAEGEGTDKGVNAIANPMAYHANLNVAGVGQVHDGGEIGSDGYDPVTISNMNYIVGKTVYVQVDNEQTITPTNGISHAAAPVRRAAKATDKKYMVLEDYYTVELTNNNGVGSKLYVLPEEDKEDKYVIGHDLVKMGMSTKKAQIWVNRYGVNLGLNTTAPIHETAEFPINLYAPVADDYTIGLAAQPDDEYTVYLTRNGEAIWNLSDAPYTISLNNGTTKGYGLRLSRKASQTPTGIDEAVVDAKGETIKVLIEDKVFIIREGNVYSVDGQLVK